LPSSPFRSPAKPPSLTRFHASRSFKNRRFSAKNQGKSFKRSSQTGKKLLKLPKKPITTIRPNLASTKQSANMSDLTKNRTANVLVWAAFIAFCLHSLHCCQARANDRAFDAPRVLSHLRAKIDACDHFQSLRRYSVAPRSPSFASRDVQKPISAGACPISRLQTEKKGLVRFHPLSNRTFATASTEDARFASADAFSTRFVDARLTPLYLRLRKLLN
jgi:hypothetical protein